MNFPSLTNVLTFFQDQFSAGRAGLLTDAISLLRLLTIFEVVFAGLYLILGSSVNVREVAKKVLVIGFFYWFITEYSTILRFVVDGFLYAGEKAGSGVATNFATLTDPAKIFIRGMQIAKPASDKLFADIGSSYFGIPSVDALMLLLCIILTVFSFAVISIQVFVTYLEYLLVATAGFILIPFGVFKPTAFLAERTFGAIISFGVKLMVLALIIGVSDKFLQTLILPKTVTWQQAIELSVISIALAFLALHAPSVAQSLLSGTPHLSFGTVAATAAGTAMLAAKAAPALSGTVSQAGSQVAAAAGAMHGGGSAAAQALGGVGEEKSLGGKSARMASKAAMYAVGGAGGLLSGAASEGANKMLYGNSSASNGSRAYRQKIGDPSASPSYGPRPGKSEGLVGAFNSGRFSVPEYRKLDEQKRNKSETQTESSQTSKESPTKEASSEAQPEPSSEKKENI